MSDKRLELKKEEEKIVAELNDQSVELEQKAEGVIKTSLIIGASIVAGYTIYKLISDDKTSKKKKSNMSGSGFFESPFVKNLMQTAIKKGIEMIVSDKMPKKQ